MANVETVAHSNGDVSIGVTIDKTFVPFQTVSASRIASLQERAENLRERSKSGDTEDVARVDAALAALPIEAKSSTSSGSKSKTASSSSRSRSKPSATTGNDDDDAKGSDE